MRLDRNGSSCFRSRAIIPLGFEDILRGARSHPVRVVLTMMLMIMVVLVVVIVIVAVAEWSWG